MTKQTGPEHAVKGLAHWVMLATALILAGCSNGTGGWSNPLKSQAEIHADMDACDKIGEEDAQLRSGHARADFAPPGGPTAGSFGPSPMQMHDRDATVQDFHRSYDNCMESKGNTRGKSAAH